MGDGVTQPLAIELQNKLVAVPFIKMKKEINEMHSERQSLNLDPKLIFLCK